MANAALKALDAKVHRALTRAGLADAGMYIPKDATVGEPCMVYVSRAVQVLGDAGQIVAPRDEVGIILDGLSAKPAQGGRVVLDGTGETLSLAKSLSDDGSLSRWVVRNG